MLAGPRLTEEGVEGIVATTNGLVAWHLTVWLDAMLQTIQLPAGIADLDTCLADVHRDALPHVSFSSGSATKRKHTMTNVSELRNLCKTKKLPAN